MTTPEKYFMKQLKSHQCQLPPSDDYEYVKKVNKFKNYFLISEKNLQSYLKVKSLSAIYYEKRRQIRTSHSSIVHPLSEFSRGWQLWMCCVHLLAVIIFPFNSAFHGPFYAKELLIDKQNFISFYTALLLVFLIRIFCLVDIAVNFMTGYVNKSNDEMVIQPSRIARRYLSTYFLVDVVSSLPVDFIVVCVFGTITYSKMSPLEHGIFSILPLFRFVRVRTLYIYFYNIYGYFSSSYSVYKMVAAVFFYFLLIHWSACLTTLVPHIIFYESLFTCPKPPCNTSWLRKENILTKSLFDQYLASLDRSVNCFTGVGFKVFELQNIEDKIVAIVIGLAGKIYWMLLLVVYLQMIATARSGKTRYLEMMDQVKQYMNQKRFPLELREKIETYYQYMFQQEFIGEKSILKLLSENLQEEIVLRMHQNLIEKITMFTGCSQTFVYNVISRLKPEIYLTGDVVYRSGEVGHCMYFISFGTLAFYAESGREIGHLEDGEYFGEVSLIFPVKRPTTAVAIEPTEVYRLGWRDFVEVIKAHPTIYPKMEKVASERYKRSHDTSQSKKEVFESKNSVARDTEEDEDEDDDFDDEELDDDLHG